MMNFDSIVTQLPVWGILSITGGLFLVFGLFLASKIWGKNARRLKAALDDSAYLAGQWATLGISQSQMVEKLGKKVFESLGESGERDLQLKAVVRDREEAINRLENQIAEMEKAKSALSKREVEALQVQIQEIEKRDTRILTLETRLKHLDVQNEQNVLENKKQVKVLLERIAALEESGGGKPDSVIQENNRQLTELLKQRCEELELLRDDFHHKERALTKLREQNAVLKKGVDDLVAGWSKKKGDVAAMGELKTRLAETTDELAKVKRDYEMRAVEIDLLQSDSIDRSDIPADLAAAKVENDEVKEELMRSSAQVDMLLDVVESRDRRVEELEAQLSSGSKNHQIQALSQTIADLQSRVSSTDVELNRTRGETLNLEEVLNQHRDELAARDLQLSLLKSKVGEDVFAEVDYEKIFEEVSAESKESNRIITESKGLRRSNASLGFSNKKNIYFSENSAFLKNESIELIKQIAEEVGGAECQINVIGFTENEGNDEFNETLSVRRAEAVREAFGAEGVDASLVVVKGEGEDSEFSGGQDSWKARRAEIMVLPVPETAN